MLSRSEIAELPQTAVLAELDRASAQRREIDAYIALLAGRVQELSVAELGYSGMAQTQGTRTADALIERATGLSRNESRTLVRVGSRAEFLEKADPAQIGVAKVDALRSGLGTPDEHVPEAELREVVERIADEAPNLTVDQVASRARAARDALDAENIARREQDQLAQRSLTITPRIDGLYNVRGVLDPESAMVLIAATDAVIAPRRGGPRFVDPAKAAEQKRAATEDERTVPQLRVDALVDLVRIATLADETAVVGANRVAVRVLTVRDTETGRLGAGHLEGHADAIPAGTVERLACENGTVDVEFDGRGFAIDVGRDQRLFTRKQRIALAARDGGCMFPVCERPPSWAEAHHIDHWAEHEGRTDTADGILLCRHHHMLLHNNGWRITRTGTRYHLHSPDGEVTQLTSKSPLYRARFQLAS